MASSSCMPPRKQCEDQSNWSKLPSELTLSIMLRLETVDILDNAQKVCSSWWHVCKHPSIWRKIDIRRRTAMDGHYLDRMCRHAVDRSEGGLDEIRINIGSDSLLEYIADRSPNLKSLGLELFYPISYNGLVNLVAKLPLLEELEVVRAFLKMELKPIGRACPKLKILKLKCTGWSSFLYKTVDDDALGIAESMPGLRHLQLLGNKLTNTGLTAILDNCPHLEHLDLRKCSNIKLFGDLEKRCLERVKEFRSPDDSTDDCPFFDILSAFTSAEEEEESEEESESEDDDSSIDSSDE